MAFIFRVLNNFNINHITNAKVLYVNLSKVIACFHCENEFIKIS